MGNLPYVASDVDIRQWVESHGFRVESAEIIYDRITAKSRGFGFVTLSNDADIQTTINALNGKRMEGRILTVNAATPLFVRSEQFVVEEPATLLRDPA